MTRRRRRQDARWSASFSLTIVNGSVRTPIAVDVCDADLESLLKGLVGRAQFRFRFNGKSRAYSVPLVNGADEAVAFRNLLRVAIAEDWDLVGSQPTPPQPVASGHDADVIDDSSTVTGPTKVRSDATGGEIVAFPARRPAPALDVSPNDSSLFDVTRPRSRDLSAVVEQLETFDGLVDWRIDDLANTNARGKGRKRRGNTRSNAEAELRFAAGYFRAGTAKTGFPAASRSLTGAGAIDSDDCIDFVTYRKYVNLRIRSRNELNMQAWARDVEAALRSGLPLPSRPELQPELASDRTIQATTKTVAAAFNAAFVEDLIPVDPWTPRVTARVEAPPRTHFTERRLPSAEVVADIVATLSTMTRETVVGHEHCTVTGDRYAFFAQASFVLHLRPEEARALRDSCWVLDHPTLPPHVIVREATPMVPSRFSANGKGHETAELKARGQGDERRLWLSDEMTKAARHHRANYVRTPDPTATDINARDPRWFTTHNEALIDPSNFNSNWWRPVMTVMAKQHPVCDAMPFRFLRHAGITNRILAGDRVDLIADEAGNTPDVIRNSYRGVIDAADHLPSRTSRPADSHSGDSLDRLLYGSMTIADLQSRLANLDDNERAEAQVALQTATRMLESE